MGNYTILYMFEDPRRVRQARNFTTNVPKILVLKSSSEQIFSRKLPLGAPEENLRTMGRKQPAARQIGERERAGGEVASCHPVRKEYFLFMYLFYYSS